MLSCADSLAPVGLILTDQITSLLSSSRIDVKRTGIP